MQIFINYHIIKCGSTDFYKQLIACLEMRPSNTLDGKMSIYLLSLFRATKYVTFDFKVIDSGVLFQKLLDLILQNVITQENTKNVIPQLIFVLYKNQVFDQSLYAKLCD